MTGQDGERTTSGAASRSQSGEAKPDGHRARAADAEVVRDLRLGVTCGLAVVGIAAAVWTGAYANPGNIEAIFAGPNGTVCCDSTSLITVRVQASGGMRSMIGHQGVRITMPQGSTVTELGERLAMEYPVLGPMLPSLAVAGSNEMQPEMLPPGRVLSDGDLVELIPLMSGG